MYIAATFSFHSGMPEFRLFEGQNKVGNFAAFTNTMENVMGIFVISAKSILGIVTNNLTAKPAKLAKTCSRSCGRIG